MEFAYRYAKPSDIGFIKKTWLYSLYNGNDDFQRMEKDTFMREYSPVIDMILTNPGTLTQVATLPDDDDFLISYAVIQYKQDMLPVLHFVYTKKMWRRQQAHLPLLPEFKFYTHITRTWKKIKPKNAYYNPFLIGR